MSVSRSLFGLHELSNTYLAERTRRNDFMVGVRQCGTREKGCNRVRVNTVSVSGRQGCIVAVLGGHGIFDDGSRVSSRHPVSPARWVHSIVTFGDGFIGPIECVRSPDDTGTGGQRRPSLEHFFERALGRPLDVAHREHGGHEDDA